MNYSLIFDMDGVIVDSEPVIEAAATAGLAEYGVSAKHDDFKPFIGTGEDSYIGGVAEKYGLTYKTEMKNRVYQIYLEIVQSKLHIYEGVRELLLGLKDRGFSMALASSADRIKIDANLEVAGIPASVFIAIISGDDVARKKPFPDIFLKAAEKLNAPPSSCVVVEDASNGIKAAKAAGMKCIALTTTFTPELLQNDHPDYICSKTIEISSILEKLIQC